MILVLALIGLVIGGLASDGAGAIGGAAFGYVVGLHLAHRRKLEALEQEVERLRRADSHWEEPRERSREPAPSPAPSPPQRPPAWAPARSTPPSSPDPRPLFEPVPAEAVAPAPAARTQAPPPQEFLPVTWVRDYFTGGNLVVRTGIIVLFFGVAFLLKFAADRNLMPIELRLAGVALGGAALLAIGWRLRLRQRAYALALQGGGVGLLYLTAFAALRLYDLLPPALTFAMLVAVAALSAFLAIGQNSPALILLGVTGGFLAPVLASTGQGNHVMLFSYYALLNAGIVAIAWFKAWRALNLLAFVFTFAIGSVWGVLRYQPEHFASTEPFLALFFVMFVAIAILFALRTAPRLDDYVDGTLVFGTPVMTMLLQTGLVRGMPYALAFSALLLSAVYLALAAAAWHWHRDRLRMLAAAFLALGAAFLTLAVPLALDGHWTAATWALEGAAVLWIGLRQNRRIAIASGALLQIGAAIAYLARYDVSVSDVPVANSQCLGALLIAVGGLATARVLASHRERLDEAWRWVVAVPVWWALTWWFVAGIGEADRLLSTRDAWPAVLGVATLTAIGCAALSRWQDWREMRAPTLLLLPFMIVCAIGFIPAGHLLAGWGLLAWPVAIAAWIGLLHWRTAGAHQPAETTVHVITLWVLTGFASAELWWQVAHARLGDAAWHVVMSALPAMLAMAAILKAHRARWWPVREFPEAHAGIGAAGLAVYLYLWTLIATLFDGGARPLPYLPIANPIELTQGLALAAIAAWILHLKRAVPADWRSPEIAAALWPAFGFAVFLFLTALLLRVLHHHFDIPYRVEDLAGSTLVQSALSIFWGLLALTGMVIGTRGRERALWFAGAALLGVVLLKMFIVDLSRTGTVARIVSFIGVGVLMLIIGRFSPVPPALRAQEAS